MRKTTDYRLTAILLMVHTLLLAVGFNVLVAVFEFPDVLRMPAEYRLNLFLANSSIIIPTYYALALTGLTQVAIAVMLYQILDANRDSLLLLATTFGVLTGVFQVLGFIRWPVLIAYLATTMQNVESNGLSPAVIAFMEGAFNHYAGMTVGEHLGFLAQAIWTTLLGVVMLRSKLFHRSLGWFSIAIGLLSFPMSLEPLGEIFAPLAVLSVPLNGAWLIVLFVMAISLLRTNAATGEGMVLGWRTLAISTLIWVMATAPAMIG